MAILKISDLSVGDWVKYEDKNYKLYAIEECGLLGGKWINGDNIAHIVKNIDYFDPIPITAEILEANGWERDEEEEFMVYYGDPTSGINHVKGTFHYRLEVPEVSVVCYFVHQLQHALRLAGVDKEISL